MSQSALKDQGAVDTCTLGVTTESRSLIAVYNSTAVHPGLRRAVTMDNNLGEVKGSSEDLAGKKKSRFQVLKQRLFGRIKRKESQGTMKQSRSISNVTAPEGVSRENDLEDEFVYSQGILGSRAVVT
ncbi:hypothetical protein AAFF_G00432590 [Aldrovandia affinis]|uniref:Uncharacterized protein n=1 Tax=Aldrovandia affinis TaxID=143900 RepID=A0AAD7S8Z9_9TELE|nr:hypothetical protein AAFF_G00432590 [Aldrovandia affinis]